MPLWVYVAIVVGLAWFEMWGVLALFAGYLIAGWWGVVLALALMCHSWDIAEAVRHDSECEEETT